MGRRKDHSPEELRLLILGATRNIIENKGLDALTARRLGQKIGYSPGTLYNLYPNLDALILAANFDTLGRLQQFCLAQLKDKANGFSQVRALAYAYLEFAENNINCWTALFAYKSKHVGKKKLPIWYRKRLDSVFDLIEQVLQKNLDIPSGEAKATGRMLWACLHGITTLALDSRLKSIGLDNPHEMIDSLLKKCLSSYLSAPP